MTYVIGGVPMQLPIMLGGGVCKFVHQLDPYLRSDLPVGALELGSITPEARTGNVGGVAQWPESYEDFQRYGFGLNAWSMPNAGFVATAKELAGIQSPHPIVVNVAGFKPEDFVEGIKTFEVLEIVKATVTNYGCPNTENIPIAYDLNSVTATREALSLAQPKKPVWEKFSAYITEDERDQLAHKLAEIVYPLVVDMSQVPTAPARFLEEVLHSLEQYTFVKAVIIANTLGNVRIIDPKTNKPVIGFNDGKAGLSGPFLRDNVTLALVRRVSAYLKDWLEQLAWGDVSTPPFSGLNIISCGGSVTGQDVVDCLKVGANGVQCVSGPSWYGDGPRFFQNLIQDSPELQEYLAQRIA